MTVMNITVNKSEMLDVMSKIQGLAGRRSSLAITECVLMRATQSGLTIIATDLESGYEGFFTGAVHKEGAIAISARKFYEIVREFPSTEILIQENENRKITIGNVKVQYHLKAMNPDDYPETPLIEDSESFEIDSAAFKLMIEKAIAISGIGEDKKAHINGAWFERFSDAQPPIIRLVSTDGSRMSKNDLVYSGEGVGVRAESVLIPKKGLHEITKFLSASGSVRVSVQGSYFVVKKPSETFYIRLLEGQFPKYDEIVSRTEGHLISLDKDPFIDMLKRMSILCTDNYRAAIFRFAPGLLTIDATNPEIGESKEDMPIDYDASPIEAAFNPRFFIDALNGIDEDKIVINLLNEEKPCLIHGAEDKSYLGVIMPMRV
jgi:DNA polymerase III subunit beta